MAHTAPLEGVRCLARGTRSQGRRKAPLAFFIVPRRPGLDGEGVEPTGEGGGQRRVHQPMPLDPALAGEGVRYDIDPVMRLPTRSGAGMARMQVGLVHDVDRLRRELAPQSLVDPVS